jgi:16S rRNA (guanine(966)-N(2))-methyltransferase RsmD
MDRMRESVFAVLGDLSGCSFLDLFSGSGIVALEAASRGASPVEAVESDRLKAKILLSNAALSPVPIRCWFMAVELYIKRAKRCFDVIFCDPPFPYRYKAQLVVLLGNSVLLAEKAVIVIHRPKSEVLAIQGAALSVRETRNYGNSAVDFIVRTEILQ